ncbi:uncharacterized protein [Argopecten irradians]|uniref:uncharacterized protein n=1 Tax=Argopecten irradians TaxID=31199 RepID=UPI00370FFBFD
MRERTEREDNEVMFGIPEQPEHDWRKRMEADTAVARQLLKVLNGNQGRPEKFTNGAGVGTIQFVQYSNPTFKDNDGKCCESIFSSDCGSGECDPYLEICIDTQPPSGTCQYGQGTATTTQNTDHLTFGSSVAGIPNPLTFTIQQGVSIQIKGYDEDNSWLDSTDDLMGSISASFSNIQGNGSTVIPSSETLTGGYIYVDVILTFACDVNYYLDCTKYCKDDPEHYTCDYKGDIVCRPAWTGANCDIRTDDCYVNSCMNNATCVDGDSSYTCNCGPNYTGVYCETLSTTTTTPTTTTTTPTTTTPTTTTTTPTTTTPPTTTITTPTTTTTAPTTTTTTPTTTTPTTTPTSTTTTPTTTTTTPTTTTFTTTTPTTTTTTTTTLTTTTTTPSTTTPTITSTTPSTTTPTTTRTTNATPTTTTTVPDTTTISTPSATLTTYTTTTIAIAAASPALNSQQQIGDTSSAGLDTTVVAGTVAGTLAVLSVTTLIGFLIRKKLRKDRTAPEKEIGSYEKYQNMSKKCSNTIHGAWS